MCRDGTCEPPVTPDDCFSACWAGCWPGSSTAPLWTYHPASAEIDLHFGALADREGNLFWWERSESGCTFVSMRIDGTERFRAASACADTYRTMLLRGQLVVFVAGRGVAARNTNDGGPAWFLDASVPEGCARGAQTMAASGDTLFVVWEETCTDSNRMWSKHVLSGVSLETGMQRFEYSAGMFTESRAPMPTVVGDAEGNVYARFANGRHGDVLVSLEADGTMRWQHDEPGPFSWPVAAVANRTYLFWYSGVDYWGAVVVRGTDGEPLPALGKAISGNNRTEPIGAGFAIEPAGRFWSTTGHALTLYEDNDVVWAYGGCSLGICHLSKSPILTGSGTLLLSGADTWLDQLTVAEVGADGLVKRTCALEPGAWTRGPFVLHDGTLVAPLVEDQHTVGVAAWRLPGLSEAESGWTSPGGGPARGGAPH